MFSFGLNSVELATLIVFSQSSWSGRWFGVPLYWTRNIPLYWTRNIPWQGAPGAVDRPIELGPQPQLPLSGAPGNRRSGRCKAEQMLMSGASDVRSSADPDDVSAQIDLIGVPWLMIGEEPSAAPNGGDARQGNVVDHHSA